jgi:hypothetical protein
MPKSKKIAVLKRLSKSQKVFIVIVTCIFVIVEIAILTEQKANNSNTTIITGHFKKIIKGVYRGSVSYDLYIEENSDPYKIAADYIDCFDYQNFIKDISYGEIINLNNSKISFFRKSFVTEIYTDKYHYLNVSCANNHIQSDKTLVPIVTLLLYPLFIIFIVNKKATLK